MSGKVTRTNPAVLEDPSLIDEDCYERGWLYAVQSDEFYAQARTLVDRDDVESWFGEQSARLARRPPGISRRSR